MSRRFDRKARLFQAVSAYSLLFVPLFLTGFFTLFRKGKSFIWYIDGTSQHLRTLDYLQNCLQNSTNDLFAGGVPAIKQWDTSVGFGMGLIGNVISFRPMNLLVALFDENGIEYFFIIRTMLLAWFAGIAFIIFISRYTKNVLSLTYGACTYALCAFTLYFGARHTFFLEMLIYLPLLIYGTDKVLSKEKSYTLILTVAWASSSYFYFLFIVAIPSGIYGIARCLILKKCGKYTTVDTIRTLGIGILHYIIGLALSSVFLLPSLANVIASSRSTGHALGHLWLWPQQFYIDLLHSILFNSQVGTYGFVAFAPLTYIAITYTIIGFKQGRLNMNESLFLLQTLMYLVLLCLPFVSSLFNGFSGQTQRWSFVITFWGTATGTLTFERLFDKNIKQFEIVSIGTFLYIVVCSIVSSSTVFAKIVGFIPVILAILFLGFINLLPEKPRINYFSTAGVVLLLFVDIAVKGVILYGGRGENYATQFINTGNAINTVKDNASIAFATIDDDSLYRVDAALPKDGNKYAHLNYGFSQNLNGISSYFGYTDAGLSSTLLSLGNAQQENEIQIGGLDNRAVLESLFGVKYYATFDSDGFNLPIGFLHIGSVSLPTENGTKIVHLYRNSLSQSMIYMYDKCIPSSVYDNLSPLQKEEALLQGAITETNSTMDDTLLEFESITMLDTNDFIQQMKCNGIVMEENRLLVLKSSTTVDITTNIDVDGELKLAFSGLEFHSIDPHDVIVSDGIEKREKTQSKWESSIYTNVSADAMNGYSNCVLLDKTHQYYRGPRDVVLNIGHYNASNNKLIIQLSFLKPGIYTFENIEMSLLPTDCIRERLSRIASNPTVAIHEDNNRIICDTESKSDSILCLAIPFSSGWTCKVDGTQVDIIRVNGMWLGIFLEKGTHTIEFIYKTPLLIPGLFITIVSTVLLSYDALHSKRVKHIKFLDN